MRLDALEKSRRERRRNKGAVMWKASLMGIALMVIAASYFSLAPPKLKLRAVRE